MLAMYGSVAAQGEILVAYNTSTGNVGNKFVRDLTGVSSTSTHGLNGTFSEDIKLTKIMVEIPNTTTAQAKAMIWDGTNPILDIAASVELINGKYYVAAECNINLVKNKEYTIGCAIGDNTGAYAYSITQQNQQILDSEGTGSFLTSSLERYGAGYGPWPASGDPSAMLSCMFEGVLI